jgi:hypothetical protein
MKTFDPVASLDNTDTNAFALSNALSKQAVAQSTLAPPEIFAPTFKADAFNAQLDNAYRSHIEAHLPKPEVDQPELRDTLKAAFQSGNTIGSALSSHTFNEGEELPNGKTKQWVITPNDGRPVAIAVICEKWANGTEPLDTFIQVTTPANALISRITDRMPAILQPEDWATWLGKTDASLADVKSVLRTFEDGGGWTMSEQAPTRKTEPAKSKKDEGQPILI